MILSAGTPASPTGPGLAVVALVGAALMTVLGLRFAAYAVRNKRANTLEARATVWDHLIGVGLIGALYGLLAAATLAVPRVALIRDLVLLALLVVIARTLASQAADGSNAPAIRGVAVVAVALLVAVAGAGLVTVGDRDPVAVAAGLEGALGIALLVYGLALSRRGAGGGAGGRCSTPSRATCSSCSCWPGSRSPSTSPASSASRRRWSRASGACSSSWPRRR